MVAYLGWQNRRDIHSVSIGFCYNSIREKFSPLLVVVVQRPEKRCALVFFNHPFTHLEEAASVEVVHSVKVPATQELTRVVVTVAVSVFSVVRERVTETMTILPILASD